MIVDDREVTECLNSFPPNGARALRAKMHALFDMVLETKNKGKVQTTLSPTIIKKRMRAYLEKK
jgi:hypothetical protein